MRKNIKNYTTEISVERTVNKIEELVVKKMNARMFHKEYKNGFIDGIIFVIPTDRGDLPFKMPARVVKVEAVFLQNKKNPRSDWQAPKPLTQTEKEQAKRTAWKNIYDWLDAQFALIETEQVKIEEVLLPYLTNQSGRTLFELMEQGNFKLPQLESGAEQGEIL